MSYSTGHAFWISINVAKGIDVSHSQMNSSSLIYICLKYKRIIKYIFKQFIIIKMQHKIIYQKPRTENKSFIILSLIIEFITPAK